MQRIRAALAVAVVVIATQIVTASAQTAIPNYAYVRDSSGQVFVISGGQRHAVGIYPASDADIAAVPSSGQWMVPKADGSGYELVAVNPWPAAPPPAAIPTDPAVRLAGERGQNTAPFDLPAGNLVATWRTQLRPGQSSCYTSATLYRVEGKRLVESIYSTTLNQRDGQSSGSGETRIYGVLAGAHYLDVGETGCSWSVEIRPL